MIKKNRIINFLREKSYVLFFLIIILIGCLWYFFSTTRVEEYNKIYQMSQSTPVAASDFFLEDLQKGVNDDLTKFSAYLIIYRYFINGGNIYEVYNFTHNHKDVSFLNEAETIYPEMFNDIRIHKLPFSYSDQGMYVSLAYFEVLEKYNYASIDTLGTLSGQYAKMAYYKRMIINDKINGLSLEYPNYTEEQVHHDIDKSKYFLKKAEDKIIFIIANSKKEKEKYNFNIIKGLVEYASALGYLESLGTNVSSSVSSKEIFDFLITYTHKFVPDMYSFVFLSNASILVTSKNIDKISLKNSLYPLLSFSLKTSPPGSSINSILQARYEKPGSRFADLTITSKANVILYAKNNLEFKNWLISNGWKESDFD